MFFDWHLALLSLLAGCTLLIGAVFSRAYEKTVFAPATAMLLTWGAALVVLAFLPLLGFYHLAVEAVLLYVMGTVWFAFIAILTSWGLAQPIRVGAYSTVGSADKLNFSHLLVLWVVIAIISYPLAIINILNYGSNMTEISYSIRRASLSGEDILNPLVSNFFVLIGVLANIFLFGVLNKKINPLNFIILVAPFVAISLIVYGRSGLVSLILGWLVIFAVFSDKLKIRYLAIPVLLLFCIIFFGGIWVKKFDVEEQTVSDTLLVMVEHIFDYFYQGPILFSRYFTDEIDVATNWDFTNSACHILSKLGMCQPLHQHADFADYGDLRPGNVYSMYFSIIPHYGYIGLLVVFGAYAAFLSATYHKMKEKQLFSLVVYPAMFSAVVLSVFKDGIGYSFYWIIKVLIICIFLRLFFYKRNYQLKRVLLQS
ncbi:O-antigen polymerase [Denitrificimonas caeni]|uniref:O-antigen polymerase n=1 Tax=Denitrificimonas caeni TaxID=521720 RepID=UPI0003B5EC76|nr:O-antigen polymerase [Denitrificimonas caeni]